MIRPSPTRARRSGASQATGDARSVEESRKARPFGGENDDSHPTDPTRTRSGRFKRDYVHNETGRRGKRAKSRDGDLAALLRSIADERIEGSHPLTGKPLTVIEGLARALVQSGFKQPKIGLAVLELMVRSGAVRMTGSDEAQTADEDAAMLEAFLGRALRQERARETVAEGDQGEEQGR